VKADDLQVGDAPVGLGKVNITLGGDVNVSAAPGKPITLVGEVNTIRGFYDYQGRRFNILRDGKVQFQGDPVNQLDPALDIAGERTIQAVTVHVNVRGRLRRPEIELTSTPPQEQADILALIIFNQPMNQLGEGQQLSLAQRAGTMAAGAVTSQLTGSIANSLNLDQFEIDLAPDSGRTAELTIGQQLGQNLYVKVQQGIGDNSQTNFVLEYEFKKWLRLQTNVLEGSGTQQQLFQRVKSTGADLVISFAFKSETTKTRRSTKDHEADSWKPRKGFVFSWIFVSSWFLLCYQFRKSSAIVMCGRRRSRCQAIVIIATATRACKTSTPT
jgi:hypothetical protein